MINLIISGPTASGKSGAAIDVANWLGNGEIISADAFQVYKGLDIGTAKVSLSEREKTTHHLIDVMEPHETYTAGLFVSHGEGLVDDIRSRGNIPIIAGGTGLYIKSLRDGIFNCPDISPEVRQELHERLKKDGLEILYKELCKLDSIYASRISQNDPVRIVRALEVCKVLGVTFTQAHEIYKKSPKHKYHIMVLFPDRAALYDEINRRTKSMWYSGWAEETQALLEAGVAENCPAFRAIGYGEAVSYIKNGGNQEDVIKEIAKQTRHFAKRQFTWFRGMDNISFYTDVSSLIDDAKRLYLSEECK